MTLSTYAVPRPLVYGQTRVPGFLIDYDDFVVTPHTDSSGGGKGGGSNDGTTSYTYSAAVLIGLCEGPIVGVGVVFDDKSQVLPSDDSVNLTVFTGTSGQAPWSYMSTNHPSKALGYDHTAYVANGSFQLGSSAAMPNLTFEVQGLKQFFPGGIIDAEPSDILTDYLTDPNHGADFAFPLDLTQWRSYCVAMSLFLSPAETTQRQASDFLTEMLQITNSDCIWSGGTLKIIPYGDEAVTGIFGSFTPNLTPLFSFTDDDYVVKGTNDEPVTVERKAPDEIFNTLRIEFLDRANQYNTAVAEATIDMDIAANGKRPMQNITFHSITTPDVARLVAQLILNRQFFIRNVYTFTVRADYCLVEPMDVIEINDSVLGLSNTLARITQIEHGTLPGRLVTITAEELPLGPGGAPRYDWELGQGYAANYGVAPGSVQEPLIFLAPPALVAAQGGFEVWIAVAGITDVWGGCNVYSSLDDANYEFVGTINGAAKYGTLSSSLPTAITQLDLANTLSVTLADTDLVIPPSTTANADDLRTLLWVDGEIIAYGNSALAGVGHYNLTYLRRGLYNSSIGAHAGGTNFARLDTGIFRLPIDPGYIGKTMYFKFRSFNSYLQNTESLADVTAYAKVLVVNSMGTMLPNQGAIFIGRGVTVVGDTLFKDYGGTAAWDSDCFSQEGFSAGAFVQWRAGNKLRFMLGLSTAPGGTTSYTGINYAFSCDGGSWVLFELGTQVPSVSGTYTPGVDTFLIVHDGVNLRYYISGVLVHALQITTLTTLFADSSFFDPGAQATTVKFGGSALVAGITTPQIGGNQVTSVSTAYVAGPVTSTSSAITQLVLTTGITLPAASDAGQQWIITATMESMSNETTDYGGQVQLQLYLDDHNPIGPSDVFQSGNVINLSTSRKPMTLQSTFTAPSNAAHTISCGIFANFTSTNNRTATAWQIQFHAELIKR